MKPLGQAAKKVTAGLGVALAGRHRLPWFIQTYGYLPNRTGPTPFARYRIILLSNRDTCV